MRATFLPNAATDVRPLTVALVFGVVVLLVAFDLKCLVLLVPSLSRFGPHDAFLLWSFGRFALTHPLAGLYNDAAVHTFQSVLYGEAMQGGDTTYYYYPPPFALLLAPLSLLPSVPAYLVFQSAGFAAFAAAVLPGGHWRLRAAMLAILPATWVALVSGQNGFLSAALLVGGMRLSVTRPVLSGILLGLLAYKPQLGLLVPVALAASGRWRTIAAAGLTLFALIVATGLVAGWDSWIAWLGSIAAHTRTFAAGRGTDYMIPTVAAMLRQMGLPPAWAVAGQLAPSIVAALCVRSRYRCRADDDALAVLCMATFLATPYAMLYDLPIYAGAIIVAVCAKLGDGSPFTTRGAMPLAAAGLLPAALTVPSLVPIGAPVLAAQLLHLLSRQRVLHLQRRPG